MAEDDDDDVVEAFRNGFRLAKRLAKRAAEARNHDAWTKAIQTTQAAPNRDSSLRADLRAALGLTEAANDYDIVVAARAASGLADSKIRASNNLRETEETSEAERLQHQVEEDARILADHQAAAKAIEQRLGQELEAARAKVDAQEAKLSTCRKIRDKVDALLSAPTLEELVSRAASLGDLAGAAWEPVRAMSETAKPFATADLMLLEQSCRAQAIDARPDMRAKLVELADRCCRYITLLGHVAVTP